MLQDVHKLCQVVQAGQLDEARPEGVVQQHAQRLNQRLQARPAPAVCCDGRCGEEVLVQLVLHLACLHAVPKPQPWCPSQLVASIPGDTSEDVMETWCIRDVKG